MWGLIRLAIHFFRVLWAWLRAIGSEKWPTAEAIVTADPATTYAASTGFTVDVPYTYRFQGELYTGLLEEPADGGVGSAFMKRFAKGRRFVVRVNPAEPEVSIMRDRDQTDEVQGRLEQVDQLQNGSTTHK
jgi:Protein of unknown function (DUF3592)